MAITPAIQETAELILENIEHEPDEPREIAGILISILVPLIINLIVKFGPKIIGKLNICKKVQLKREIRNACPTREHYNKYGDKIFDATIKTLPQITEQQLSTIQFEIKQYNLYGNL